MSSNKHRVPTLYLQDYTTVLRRFYHHPLTRQLVVCLIEKYVVGL